MKVAGTIIQCKQGLTT